MVTGWSSWLKWPIYTTYWGRIWAICHPNSPCGYPNTPCVERFSSGTNKCRTDKLLVSDTCASLQMEGLVSRCHSRGSWSVQPHGLMQHKATGSPAYRPDFTTHRHMDGRVTQPGSLPNAHSTEEQPQGMTVHPNGRRLLNMGQTPTDKRFVRDCWILICYY